MKDKNIEFIGMWLPRRTVVGSADGDIGVEKFVRTYNHWIKDKVGCAMCGDKVSEVYAFDSRVEDALGDMGICMRCIDRLNTKELTVGNIGSNGAPPFIREADKTID